MSLERLNLNSFFAISSVYDTELSAFCSRCEYIYSFLMKSEVITRRNCVCPIKRRMQKIRPINMIFNKYLLIYFLTLLSVAPLTYCLKHQDHPIESSLTQKTPVKNSIDLVDLSNEKNSEEESDGSNEEDPTSYQSSAEIRKYYEKQQEIFAKKVPAKNNVNSDHMTSTSPKIGNEGSCSSNACLVRQDIEAANTESIKKHILLKLGMDESTLNKTNYPKLNEKLLESLCKKININPEDCLGRKSANVEYQSDDPVDSVYDDFDEDVTVVKEEEDVQFLSYENRIYAFPSSKFSIYFLFFNKKKNVQTF